MRTNLMLRRTRVALIALLPIGLGLGLAACNDNDRDQDGNGNSGTVSSVASAEIAQSTTETADPILLNDLMLSDRDTNETDQPTTF